MSFQTFNLFNFFQQPNTGSFKTLSVSEREIATTPSLNSSGAVADFNWFFPYAQKTIPNAIILGRESSFSITLLSDSYEIFPEENDSILGIRYPKAKVYLSGNFLKDINKINSKISFSGKFFPKDFDETNTKLNFSGNINREPPDLYYSKIKISGKALNDKGDSTLIDTAISGDILKTISNFNDIKTYFSGIIESGTKNLKDFQVKISGNFNSLYKDSSNLEYSLLDYSTGELIIYKEVLEDEVNNLSYSLENYNLNDIN